MAVDLKAFELDQMQQLVRYSVNQMDERHTRWRLLETIYRTGSLAEAEQVRPGKLSDLFPSLQQNVVNMVLPHINIILASVVSRDPQFVTVPVEGGDEAEQNAEIAEAVVNYFWKRLGTTRELRDATADAVRLGSGFVKVGWRHLEHEVELSENERRIAAVDQFEKARLTALLEGEEFDQQPEGFLHGVPHAEMRTLRSEPFAEYVSPYDIFVPDSARRMDDLRWVAHRVTLPVDEVLANPEFNVSEETIVRDGRTVNPADEYQAEWRRQVDSKYGSEYSDVALDTATLWEFYDMRTRRLTVFQLESSEPLWDGELPWSHRYPPFVHIRNFTASGNDFWGFGDIENIANLQSMMNEFLDEQVHNARRSGQKYFIRKDVITPEIITALESSESDLVAPVEIPAGENLSSVLVPVERRPLSNDIYTIKLELQNYMREVMGINDFQAGGMGADRMSATAAAVVEGVATLRAQDKIMAVEQAAAGIGQMILLLCQEYLDEPTAIRVSGFEQAVWPEITKSDLYGEFKVSVEGGSLKALNPATREQQGLRLLNEVVPALAQLGFDPEPALRVALKDLGFNPEQMLIPMEQPMDEMQGSAPQPGLSTGGEIAEMGGPTAPAEAQQVGDIII